MSSIAELIADYQARRLTLPGLFDALAARGALPDETCRDEQALLVAMAADGRLEPGLARALAAKLRSLQPPAPASAMPPAAPPAAVDDDVTKVRVLEHGSAPPPDAEMTMVQPASRPPAADADATVVAPASR